MKALYAGLSIVIILLCTLLYVYYHNETDQEVGVEKQDILLIKQESNDVSLVEPKVLPEAHEPAKEKQEQQDVVVGEETYTESDCKSYVKVGDEKTCLVSNPTVTDNPKDDESAIFDPQVDYADDWFIEEDFFQDSVPIEPTDLKDVYAQPDNVRDVDVFDIIEW